MPELGKVGLRIAFLVLVPSLPMLFFLEPGTPEHSITIITIVMGVVFLAGVIALIVRGRR
ncbi:MAG: hypothetical protein ACRDJ5_10955 [Actinomycetota bacterium]